MADSFFGFDTTLTDGLEDGLDGPLEDDLEEEEYDALNDETFGSEATIGDWEKDHEKLAQITESSRPQHHVSVNKKNGINHGIDIEDSLSHLVLDEKEGIVPRPGVWDSPPALSLNKVPPPTLPPSLKNVCTVEELERGLIANRPPPGLSKPPQHQQKSDGSTLFNALSMNEKLQINGLPPTRFPPGLGIPGSHPVVIPPNMRLPHPQFMQHPRLLPNQPGNMLRYTLPPHLMLPHGPQRQQLHGPFGSNFPQPPHPNLGPAPFLRLDHPMLPPFSAKQNNHQPQHSFPLSGNQRNQNRPFHHIDQQANHQPFFKNNQYPHRNHDRNNQRQYHYQHHPQGMNGMSTSGEYDEYAGLMSSREKQWLINIQLLQLNTSQPYVDDYYYTVFCERQNKTGVNKKHQNNNGYHRDSRDRDQSQNVLSKVVYTPTQFENSLGKLQCGSVTAPRKLIDMDVVPNSDPQSTPQLQQRDTKKTRQLLLEIERLYTIQLKLEDLTVKLEDLNESLSMNPGQAQQDDENNTETVKKTARELIGSMLTSLLHLIQDDKLASMLSIRKGKTLFLRFLPEVNVTAYSNQLAEIWVGILRGLAIIGRRDVHLLTDFYPEFRKWLTTVRDANTIIRLAKALSDSASQPVKSNSLAFALMNKFGVSIIASLLERIEQLHSTENALPSEWSAFILTITDTIGDSKPCVSPCEPISPRMLQQHLQRISSPAAERYSVLEPLLTNRLAI